MLQRYFRDIHWNNGLQLIGICVKKKGGRSGGRTTQALDNSKKELLKWLLFGLKHAILGAKL